MTTDVSPDDNTPVLRQRDLIREVGRIGRSMTAYSSQKVELRVRLLIGYGEFDMHVVEPDGVRKSVRMPDELEDISMELREKVMNSPDGGTWLSALFVISAGGGVQADFNYDAEPEWSHELDPVLYAQELRAFPRGERSTPGWLRRKVDSVSGGSES